MKYYVQVDKVTKRVSSYGSSSMISDEYLEVVVDDTDPSMKSLLDYPIVYVFDEATNVFTRDSEYETKLETDRFNRVSDSQKLDILMKQQVKLNLANMEKDNTIKMLVEQQMKSKLEIMELKKGGV